MGTIATHHKTPLAQLQAVSTLGPDWDGYGADAPNQAGLDLMASVVRLLPESTHVYACPSGATGFEWVSPSGDADLLVEFTGREDLRQLAKLLTALGRSLEITVAAHESRLRAVPDPGDNSER